MAGDSSFWSTNRLFGDQPSSPSVLAQAKQAPPPKAAQTPQSGAPAPQQPQQGAETPPAEKTETANLRTRS
jgi:hypothetical protein